MAGRTRSSPHVTACPLVSRFPDLLRELDRDRATLGMRSYGLSVTTMEEVFLNVSQAAQAAHTAQATHAARAVHGVNGDASEAVKDADVRSQCLAAPAACCVPEVSCHWQLTLSTKQSMRMHEVVHRRNWTHGYRNNDAAGRGHRH